MGWRAFPAAAEAREKADDLVAEMKGWVREERGSLPLIFQPQSGIRLMSTIRTLLGRVPGLAKQAFCV